MKKRALKMIGTGLNWLYRINPPLAIRRTVQWFSKPQRNTIPKERKRFLLTAEWQTIKVDGRILQTYFWKGGSRTILLVHGWGSEASRWKDLVTRLQDENYAVIALDAPGHGHSEGRFYDQNVYGHALREIAKKHNVEAVIGHSLGGFTLLLEYQKEELKGVRKLVFMGTPVSFDRPWLEFQNNFGLNKALSKGFENYFLQTYGLDLINFTFLDFPRGFKISQLFIHDQEDEIVAYEPTAQVAEQWENAQLFSTLGLGHGLKDEKVYIAILGFLKD